MLSSFVTLLGAVCRISLKTGDCLVEYRGDPEEEGGGLDEYGATEGEDWDGL